VSEIIIAVGAAFRDLRAPRILAVLLLPMVGAILLWSVLSLIYWDTWSAWLGGLAAGTAAGRWLENIGAGWLLNALTALGVIALVIPAILITALVINEIVVMPTIVSHIGSRYFTHLDRRAGGTLMGSVLNALIAISLFAVLWLVTLPLWLTGLGAVAVPVLLSAYLNQRLLRYDALSEHANRDEYARIVTGAKGRLYGLGIVVALLYYIPLVNLIAPVASGLAYTHLCLAELSRLRRAA
jgi:CysZ protein